MNSVRSKLLIFNFCQGLIISGAILLFLYVLGWNLSSLLLGAGAGIVVALLSGYFFFNSLTKILVFLLEVTEGLINADLSLEIQKKEYGWKELSQLADNIRRVAKGINKWFKVVSEHTDHLTAASEKIISGSEQVSAGSQDQAEQVQQLLFSIEEMSRVSNENAGKAQYVADFSRNAVKTARSGDAVVLRVSESIDSVNAKIKELSQRSQEIVKFLKLINEIAAQTDLLALNAAIEAARAGEYGRGFAVVAEEVRKLAENASEATKEINDLVENIQSSIGESVQAVSLGLEQTNQAKEAFNSIMKLIENMEEVISGIASTSRLQADETEKMVQAVHSISTVAQEAAASSEEVTAVVHDLDALSEGLRKLSGMWKFS